MENIFATIQIKNTYLKLFIGYLHDNHIQVIYKKNYPLSESIKDGDIYNLNSLKEDLKKLSHINDNSVNLKIELNEIVLILDPFGLEVFNSEKTTTTISSNGIIQKTDIKNVINMVYKSLDNENSNEIVDIVPNVFSIDNDEVFDKPPLGIVSNSLLVKAHVYTLPKNYVDSFKKAFLDSSIGIKKIVVSPLGIETLISKDYPNLNKYLLIDYNQDNTIVSFIANKKLYGSKYFSIGGNEVTKLIANNFEISMDKAEKLKKIYGLDSRENEYNPSIVSVEEENGFKKEFNKNDLSQIISSALNEWKKMFDNCVDTLLDGYSNLIEDIPFVFVGNSTLLKGFKDFISYYYPNNESIFYRYKTIGGNLPGDVKSIGAISFVSTYKGSLEDESRIEISPLSRKEYREEDDEL